MFSKIVEMLRILLGRYRTISYSQEGEDILLNRVLGSKSQGFYIDIGAHHPIRFSNTYLYYKRGWSGLNVDAMPGSMDLFKKIRPRDINLEAAIALEPKEMKYFMFNEPALNGFDVELTKFRAGLGEGYKVIGTKEVQTTTLEAILDRHLPGEVKVIDFMSVDVEGLDLDVLKSNNWNRYRPQYIWTELLNTELKDLGTHPVSQFLESVGYHPISKIYNSVLFAEKN